ncbi:hypothetical protein VNI00_018359, partial [Paramarasmius palmivorus]
GGKVKQRSLEALLEHRREIIASHKRLVEVQTLPWLALKESDQRLDCDLAAQIRRCLRVTLAIAFIHITFAKAGPRRLLYTEDHINCLMLH